MNQPLWPLQIRLITPGVTPMWLANADCDIPRATSSSRKKLPGWLLLGSTIPQSRNPSGGRKISVKMN
jgi:hypothetical protein